MMTGVNMKHRSLSIKMSRGGTERMNWLNLVLERCHVLFHRMRDSYRPERHYMRGPGPRWRATHRTDRPGSSGGKTAGSSR
jgi:hypothetical protein